MALVINTFKVMVLVTNPPALTALVKVMADPDIRQRLAVSGMDATSNTPQQFAKLLSTERAKWGDLIRKAGIQGD